MLFKRIIKVTTDSRSRVTQIKTWYNEAIEKRCSEVSYAGVIRLLFLIRPLYTIDMWSDENQRTNTIKTYDV